MKPLLVEEMLTELHRGNFNPSPPEVLVSACSQEMHSKTDKVTASASDDVDSKAIDAAPEVQAKCEVGETEGGFLMVVLKF